MEYCGLSELYDRLMSDVDYASWCGFIAEKCHITKDSFVVDSACGTGSIAIGLAMRGARVTAVDCSEEMLGKAAQRARENGVNIAFVCEDMAKMRFHKPADAVCCVCDGVNYLKGAGMVKSFFENVFMSLKQGGVFVFDISSEYKLSKVLGSNIFFEDYDDLTYFWQNRIDNKKRLIKMELCFFIKEGGLYRRFDEIHTQYMYSSGQLFGLLEGTGFSDIEVYDCYSGNKINNTTQRITFVCTK